MKPEIKIDTREFSRALKEYMRHTKRDLSEVLNGWAYDVAWQAFFKTHKATIEQIRQDYTKEVMATREDGSQGMAPLAGVLVQKLRKKRKGAGWQYPKQLRPAVRAFINRRIKAIGFMRSGWMVCIQDLSRVLGKRLRRDKFSKSNSVRGRAIPARVSWTPETWLFNSAITRTSPQGAANLQRYAGRALQLAIAEVVAAKRKRIDRKLADRAKKYSRGKYR